MTVIMKTLAFYMERTYTKNPYFVLFFICSDFFHHQNDKKTTTQYDPSWTNRLLLEKEMDFSAGR